MTAGDKRDPSTSFFSGRMAEITGSALGAAGTFVMALSHTDSSRIFAWLVWFLSNLFLIRWSLGKKAYFVLAMNIVFMIADVIGIYNIVFSVSHG